MSLALIPNNKLVLLGVGQTARAFARYVQDDGLEVWGTTRGAVAQSPGEAGASQSAIRMVSLQDKPDLAALCAGACVLVSFPPDGTSDRLLQEQISDAAIVYISSTAVYGGKSGVIDNASAADIDSVDSRVTNRLAAESIWRQAGAVVLRAPGLYSPESGMHKRIASGNYRLPGDGSNYVSRIHLDDLAAIIAGAFSSLCDPSADTHANTYDNTYVTADLKPSTHKEVAEWLCQRLRLPLPQAVPLDQVDITLRGNRQIDSRQTLERFKVKLKYPSYVEGFEQCIAASGMA